ncbi:MAG TPA: Rne/Rng family ribonuclease [Candidatus Limnocylindria bacterium]|nr:Rne/Rng family ribonuclease [Candidatus Limnocylindria bacterium]
MSKEMVISANPHETRVAIMEEGQLCEYYVEREKEFALVGSIYKGRVTRVLPGMQSAFVEIGLDSDAFLYVSDFLEDLEEFDHIVTTVEEKVQKMESQGGQVFAAEGATAPTIEPSDVEPAPFSANEAVTPEPSFPASAPAAPETNFAPPISSPPVSGNRDRGGFEHRRHEGRREGRFGRRGGRGGSRHGGGRPGGGRGDRPNRFSRELPQSKYASSRPYEDHSAGAAPGEGAIQTILPGESLAKYKERPPSPPVSTTPSEESFPTTNVAQATPESVAPATPVSTPWEPAPRTFAPARSEFQSHSSSSGGLEPLPGESLSKWKTREHPVEEHPEAAIPAVEHHFEGEPRARESRDPHVMMHAEPVPEAPAAHHFEQAHHAAPIQDDLAAQNLSEDEAAALAEQVAEAQAEEAARNAQQRDFAAQEESHQADLSSAEEDSPETDEEHDAREADAEEEAEEAQAEAEGMISHPAELEHPEGNEAEGMHVESDSNLTAENQPPQEQQPWKAQVRGDFRARMQHPARRGGRDRGPRRDDRGRRPQHGHGGGSHGHHRPQPRRTQLIADMLKQGQEIIVQIAKEPLGKKGARITSHVALPGRYLVYMPTLDHTGVSRKIASAEDRARLRHLVNEAKGAGGGGFIVRTAAGSATPDEIRTDVEFLMRTWAEIKSRSEQRKAPSLLHRDLNLVERILRDYMSPDYTAVWVDTEEEFTKVVDFMSRFQPQLVNRVKLYTKDTPVFEEFGIQQEIDKGLRPKVWLKSGGYIVINHTEALVAIDVNTGKFVGKGSNRLEDTIVRTNLEAVKEIVRQMRLRDLGGIIIIDFIDMEERRNREKVMAALEDALRADRAPSKVLRFNEFGLVAITRKRTKQALERTLCQPCPYCTGSGMVKSIPTLCYEIQCEARKMASEVSSGSLTLRVHPEISKALKTRESSLIEELEQWTKKSIIIQADPTLHWEQYDIY